MCAGFLRSAEICRCCLLLCWPLTCINFNNSVKWSIATWTNSHMASIICGLWMFYDSSIVATPLQRPHMLVLMKQMKIKQQPNRELGAKGLSIVWTWGCEISAMTRYPKGLGEKNLQISKRPRPFGIKHTKHSKPSTQAYSKFKLKKNKMRHWVSLIKWQEEQWDQMKKCDFRVWRNRNSPDMKKALFSQREDKPINVCTICDTTFTGVYLVASGTTKHSSKLSFSSGALEIKWMVRMTGTRRRVLCT